LILGGGVVWLASVVGLGFTEGLKQGLAPFALIDVTLKTGLVVGVARVMHRAKRP
jgi:biotin transporter BioY